MLPVDSSEFEVLCVSNKPKQPSPLPLIHNDQVYFVVLADEQTADVTKSGHIESYSLVDGKNNKKYFSNCKSCVCPVMLLYMNRITILGSDSDVGLIKRLKVSLHQFNEDGHHCVWESLQSSEASLNLDIKNACCAPYKEDRIVVVSVLNQVPDLAVGKMTFSLFSPLKIEGRHWRQASILLPNLSNRLNYYIQSCVIESNYIYCIVLLKGKAVYIHKVDFTPLCRRSEVTHEEDHLTFKRWVIEDHKLQDCFVFVLKGEVVVVTFMNIDNKTIMNVWQFNNFVLIIMPKPEGQFDFQSMINVVTASISDDTLTVIYHDDKRTKCYAKKFHVYFPIHHSIATY